MDRIEQLREKLGAGFGAALITNGHNRGWLTGMLSSAGILVVTEKSASLIIDFRYIEAARAEAKRYLALLESRENDFKYRTK